MLFKDSDAALKYQRGNMMGVKQIPDELQPEADKVLDGKDQVKITKRKSQVLFEYAQQRNASKKWNKKRKRSMRRRSQRKNR